MYNVAAQSPQQLADLCERELPPACPLRRRESRAFPAQRSSCSPALPPAARPPRPTSWPRSWCGRARPPKSVSLDNFFRGAQSYPKLPDGTLDYENPDTLDLPLIRQCLRELSETGKTTLPVYDFASESRSSATENIDLQGGVCIVEGIHALNPELTGLVKGDDIYRIYAGLREEYCIDGRRVINTQDIRLCRRTLRDAATRGRSPDKTLAMWDRVLDGETRYIKGFKTTADFLLDTSFTYELGLIAQMLRKVLQQFQLEGHNAELWDETARRFEHVMPVSLHLLPADSMLREFYSGEVSGKAAE